MVYRICMVSDFFFPNMGGVEEHIYNLSQCLLLKGHKVVIMTHSYGDRIGVFYNQCVLPTMICNIQLIRYIFIRERIEIIHGHSAFSALAHEGMLIGNLMGLKVTNFWCSDYTNKIQTVFTDHSLFGFADASAVITNKLLQISLAGCNHCICVSHTGKENTVLRAQVNAKRISVIPNAVDTFSFTPDPSYRSKTKITIVVVSRLVYRKGVDLTAQIISEMCSKHEEIDFLIAGDGPKRWLLEEIRERQGLQDRVTLLGSLEHSQVRNVLIRGHIFLNTSLTEAYCMAIVEAASCGLQVVSTKVGGIPEVLPKDLIYLTEPNVAALIQGLKTAINDFKNDNVVCPYECNNRIRKYYNWANVSERTEVVYQKIAQEKTKTLGEQLWSYSSSGVWPYLLVISLCYLILTFYNFMVPKQYIDIAKDYKTKKVKRNEFT